MRQLIYQALLEAPQLFSLDFIGLALPESIDGQRADYFSREVKAFLQHAERPVLHCGKRLPDVEAGLTQQSGAPPRATGFRLPEKRKQSITPGKGVVALHINLNKPTSDFDRDATDLYFVLVFDYFTFGPREQNVEVGK